MQQYQQQQHLNMQQRQQHMMEREPSNGNARIGIPPMNTHHHLPQHGGISHPQQGGGLPMHNSMYHQMQRSGVGMMYGNSGNDMENELPSSLPSYMPPPTPGAPTSLGMNTASNMINTAPYGYYNGGMPMTIDREGDPNTSAKRQAPLGQWKTPPQFLYVAAKSEPHDDPKRPNSPSSGMRGMTFQDSSAMNLYGMGAGGLMMDQSFKKKTGYGRVNENIGGISAKQFAESTGGLTLDTTLLAKMSGKDPSEIGAEQIRNIMQCPDLLTIYQKLQEEDDRRQRRYVCAILIFIYMKFI